MVNYKFISVDKAERDRVAAKLAAKSLNTQATDTTQWTVRDARGGLLAVQDKEPDEDGYKKLNDEKKIAASEDVFIVESDVMP